MSDKQSPDISIREFKDFVSAVKTAVDAPSKNETPAFTLIVGAGFSSGLIPMAYEMALYDIPWWLYEGRDTTITFTKAPRNDAAFLKARNDRWLKIKDEQSRNTGIPHFEVDSDGCPLNQADNIALCYKAIMCASSGLGSQESRTGYLRDVNKRNDNEINYANLFLAGILQAQRLKTWKTELHHRRPFCRTVLTTNFDTLLQRALLLNSQLFFVSDQPESHFDTPDDDSEAVHIVQTHGSIFRPFVANSAEEIRRMREENAATFRGYFEKRGIIVMGYGGWDDTIMKALEDCKHFNGNLYWCDIHPKGSLDQLRSNVRTLLEKHKGEAFYVPLCDGWADIAMRDLHEALGLKKYPRVLVDPLPNLIDSIKGLKLPESLLEEKTLVHKETGKADVKSLCDIDNPRLVVDGVIELLETFATEFTDPQSVKGRMVLAQASMLCLELKTAQDLWTKVLDMSEALTAEKALALFSLGLIQSIQGDTRGAMEAWMRVIEMPGAPVEMKAQALNVRGLAKEEQGDAQGAMEDCTRMIEMPDATAEMKALALFNRGATKGTQGDTRGASEDYTRVIEMPDAPAEQRAKALFNRGATKGTQGDTRGASEDYTRVIEMPDAPAEQRAKALFNRGATKGTQGDARGATEDYTRVIEMPDAPEEIKEQALGARVVTKHIQGDANGVMEDCTRVIEMPDAPAEHKAKALGVRGLTKEDQGDVQGAIEDYTRVIEMPDVPTALRAGALYLRGVGKGQQGDTLGEMDDYTRLIKMPDAPAELKAQVLVARSDARNKNKDCERALADSTLVIGMEGATREMVAQAYTNRAESKYFLGDKEGAREDVTAALAMPEISDDCRKEAERLLDAIDNNKSFEL
jgi:tetratricopeptide (TPR) repeat protein